MEKKTLEKRLQELGIYSDYYYRKELKPLGMMLREDESLNCILTGVHNGNRKLLAVTDRRIAIIFSGALGSGEVKVIKRPAVKSYAFHKKLFLSSVRIETSEESLEFTNTQGGMKELFEWAMQQPFPTE